LSRRLATIGKTAREILADYLEAIVGGSFFERRSFRAT
jgi:hypothetical protein